ncbi:hypothetical protein [Pseudoalteromonas neustonica]|uniref:hypothetical protein n=1 Tax=Pseudoalteromonas neustonica TaxID=1840331 RepID=UPI0007DB21E7|nr:hypothetical protein [Pseudoalteromonas neustonica]
MIDFFTATSWTIRILELAIVLNILYLFKQHRLALFFGGQSNLNSTDDHTMHSCFIAALTVMVFHFVSSHLSQYILTIEMSKLELRQFFYFSMFSCSVAFSATLFFLHTIRGCTFSKVARICLYLAIAQAALQMMQFVMRGMLDNSTLSPFYSVAVVLLNIASLGVIAVYPLTIVSKIRKEEI